MLSFKDAQQIALREIEKLNSNLYGDPKTVTDYILLNDKYLPKPYGWVFFYNSKRYLETGDLSYALAGNAPFIVNRYDGSVTGTGTAYRLEHYLAEYEKQHGY